MALYITSKISRRPYIVKLRGNHYRVRRILYGERKINKIYDILETHSLRQAKAIIVTSNYLKELAKSLGINARKIFRVHYPVDTQKFRPMDTKPKTDVLFPARLSPEKGAHILLKIARLHPTIEFLFVGAKQMDIRNFPRNAKWVGPQPHSKMPYFYNSAKLVVIPSLSEGGMPQSCLEAFSCGKSVIVTDVSDNKIVKELDLGWVVKRGNMKRLAEAISYALSHPRELKEKGKRARQYSLQFTYKKYGQEVRAAFLFTSGPS